MGFNGARSLTRARRSAESGGDRPPAYPPGYWSSRAERLLIPYLVVWAIALVAGQLLGTGHLGVLTLVGLVPLANAPGNYFITVLVQFVVLLPAFAVCFRRWPRASVAGAVVVNVGFELAAGQVHAVGASPTARYLYEAALPKYAICLVAGIVISQIRPVALLRWIAALAVPSVAYLVALRLHPDAFSWLAPSFSRRTNCFAVFYSVALVVAGLAGLPRLIERLPAAWRPLEEVGRASYHIFLVQMVWFGVVSDRSVAAGIAGIAASALLGYGFFRLPMPSLGLGAGARAAAPRSGTS
jgi:fucose 4-O-acetylase-like acetyltransferase